MSDETHENAKLSKSLQLFRIGRLWLIADAFLFGCVGFILAVDPGNLLFRLWDNAYEAHFQPASKDQLYFLAGPLGGTFVGSYIMTGFLAAIPLKQKQRWAWWALTFSLLGWFVLDSTMNVLHNAWFNIFQINLVALFMQGVPLALTAPEIFRADQANR